MTNSFYILTLFPEMFPGPLKYSLSGKALEKKDWSLNTVNIRDYATNKHSQVDDTTYGGGSGLLIKPDCIGNALDHVISLDPKIKIIYLSPKGNLLTQMKVEELTHFPSICIICGRYEGIDQRVLDYFPIEEISIGDFVLSGGEIAALALMDALLRKKEAILSNESSYLQDSLTGIAGSPYLLEYPQYTKPQKWRGFEVPEVLTSGNHNLIDLWRQNQSEIITKTRRPDLWAQHMKKNQ